MASSRNYLMVWQQVEFKANDFEVRQGRLPDLGFRRPLMVRLSSKIQLLVIQYRFLSQGIINVIGLQL
jgi:hypothetical protein